jgi:symplekin
MRGVVNRICDGGEELQDVSHALSAGALSDDMWMLLIIRVITRVAEPPVDIPQNEDRSSGEEEQLVDFSSRQDKLRQVLCDYIMVDFPSR